VQACAESYSADLCDLLFSDSPCAEGQDEIACWRADSQRRGTKRSSWNGYENLTGPARNPEEVEYKCTAAIYSSAGRVVFRTSGFNVVFDEHLTGEDF